MENSLTTINYYLGDVEPLVFAPGANESFLLYGVQVRPFSIQNVQKKDQLGRWYYVASFELEEEF